MSARPVGEKSPPDAPRPPFQAAAKVPRDENDSQSSRHDPSRCATCLGAQPWTSSRREEVRSLAWERRGLAEVTA